MKNILSTLVCTLVMLILAGHQAWAASSTAVQDVTGVWKGVFFNQDRAGAFEMNVTNQRNRRFNGTVTIQMGETLNFQLNGTIAASGELTLVGKSGGGGKIEMSGMTDFFNGVVVGANFTFKVLPVIGTFNSGMMVAIHDTDAVTATGFPLSCVVEAFNFFTGAQNGWAGQFTSSITEGLTGDLLASFEPTNWSAWISGDFSNPIQTIPQGEAGVFFDADEFFGPYFFALGSRSCTAADVRFTSSNLTGASVELTGTARFGSEFSITGTYTRTLSDGSVDTGTFELTPR